MMDRIIYMMAKILPSKIQASMEKANKYNVNTPKYLALTKMNFIQFDHPKFYGTISIDIDKLISELDIYDLCNDNNIPLPTLIVQTTKGKHLHWFLDDTSLIWKNNPLRMTYRKELIKKLNMIFGGDKHSAGHIFRNPITHNHIFMDRVFTFNNFDDIIYFKEFEEDFKNKKIKVEKTTKINRKGLIDFSKIKKGNRNNTLLLYIRTFMFQNWYKVEEFYLKEALRVNKLMEEPLEKTEIFTIVSSAFKFVNKNYKEGYVNKKQAEFNRKLAKKKAEKTICKLKDNFIQKYKDGKISNIAILRNLISFYKLSKILKISDKTIKKYYQLLVELVMDLLKENKLVVIDNMLIDIETGEYIELYSEDFIESLAPI